MREYPVDSLREEMGFVMQEPALMSYSVLDNILYGKQNALNSEVLVASEYSNAIEFILRYSVKRGFHEK